MLTSTLLLLAACNPAAATRPAAPPNVVMIVSDDQGWTDFGFMGHKAIRTPNLDRLASQSLVFENGYVTTPLCRPSLATILTGRYPHEHRITCNDPPDGTPREAEYGFIRETPTVPRLLGAAGYRSFQTGKFWEGHHSNGGFTDGMTVKGRHGDDGLVIGRKTMQPIHDFIESCAGQPFFVWYAPMLPHAAHNPPRRILKKYEAEGRPEPIARYWAMCEWFDETCGDLLRYLEEKKLAENTLVVFVTDNGWLQSETKVGESVRSKREPYDAGLRTPIMVRWPGRIEPRHVQDLASSIDLAPTILAACGVEPPAGLPGLNLLQIARGGRLKRDAVYGEVFLHTSSELGNPAASVTHRWIRRGDWKLIMPKEKPSEAELYNVAQDPVERKNLAGDNRRQVEDLARALDGWWSPK